MGVGGVLQFFTIKRRFVSINVTNSGHSPPKSQFRNCEVFKSTRKLYSNLDLPPSKKHPKAPARTLSSTPDTFCPCRGPPPVPPEVCEALVVALRVTLHVPLGFARALQ